MQFLEQGIVSEECGWHVASFDSKIGVQNQITILFLE